MKKPIAGAAGLGLLVITACGSAGGPYSNIATLNRSVAAYIRATYPSDQPLTGVSCQPTATSGEFQCSYTWTLDPGTSEAAPDTAFITVQVNAAGTSWQPA